jgi:pectate lyase
MITNINPKYVWGGDAITVDDADMIWIDHVTVPFPSINETRTNR